MIRKSKSTGKIRDRRPAPQLRALAGLGPDHLLAPGPNPEQRHGRADLLGDELEVLTRGLGQVGVGAALAEVLLPAAQLGELGGGVMQDRLVVGEVLDLRSLGAAVPRADLNSI